MLLNSQKSGAAGSFGERLRREREMRGVSLEEISAATRISTRFLLALERENWEQLPGGVFNRGFIRSISRFLGLDPEVLIAEYALVTKDHPSIARIALEPSLPRKKKFPWAALLALILVIVAAGGWMAYQRFGSLVQAWRNPEVPPPPRVTLPQPPPPAPDAAATIAPATAPNSAASSSEPASLELRVDVSQATVVTLLADGKRVFRGRMSPGRSLTFTARDEFEISAENAGVVVLEMNGRLMPAVGLPGEAGKLKLTRNDLKRAEGGSH